MSNENVNMNVLGSVLNFEQAVCRPFYDAQDLINAMRRNMATWAWGAQKFTVLGTNKIPMGFRFKVNGLNHKGLVYVAVNGLDYFDIYYTNNNHKIKFIDKDICLDNLIEVLDHSIENKFE